MAGKLALGAVAIGLVLVLAGGISVAVWKIRGSAGRDNSNEVNPPIAFNANGDSKDKPGDTGSKVIPAKGNSGPNKVVNPPQIEDDEDTKKLKAAEKKGLQRKTPIQPGGEEFDWQPPINVKNQKDVYVGLNQKKINLAIEKGVIYLKQTQTPDGKWGSGHAVGHSAIGGLTLLECGSPGSDVFVQRAAHFVRANTATLDSTYELSLAVLFLDRLGEPRDRPLIQGMALRLLAGQNDSGGWSYSCPQLSPPEMFQLYAFLHSNKRPNLLNPIQATPAKPVAFPMPIRSGPGSANDPFQQFNALTYGKGIETPAELKGPNAKTNTTKPIRPEWLQASLQGLAVVKNQGKGKGQQKLRSGAGDNSNTQFAILALWAARRHDVPTDNALLSSYERFATSQSADGGWNYSMGTGGSTNTMTCVGLLGEAMGHGVAPDIIKFNAANPKESTIRPALEDPRIQNGLKALSRHIGQPMLEGNPDTLQSQNHYFLWSVERVAMLYDLKTINGKEWYPWGAQILVHRQHAEGDWPSAGYHGSNATLNTCFALLFLKRSNLVQDLTNQMRLYAGIRDSEK